MPLLSPVLGTLRQPCALRFQASQLLYRGPSWVQVWLQPTPGPDPLADLEEVAPGELTVWPDMHWVEGCTYPCQQGAPDE